MRSDASTTIQMLLLHGTHALFATLVSKIYIEGQVSIIERSNYDVVDIVRLSHSSD